MYFQETSKQCRLVGETAPLWLAVVLALLGFLGSVATARLLTDELRLRIPWTDEANTAYRLGEAQHPQTTPAKPTLPDEAKDRAETRGFSVGGLSSDEAALHGAASPKSLPTPQDAAGTETQVLAAQNPVFSVQECPALFNVTFTSESAEPMGPADLELRVLHLRDWLNSHPETKLLIEGHTDSWGDRQYNLQLSSRRAEAVSRLLTEAGVSRKQLVTRALGAEKPVMGKFVESRLNRRVSLRVEGLESCPETPEEDGKR
jgi:outer membrane protein OmpA-like peptidoglycan-associated protein